MPSAAEIICLLDDEPSVLRALGRLLVSDGMKVQKFSEPACFLDHARDNPVRVAVIDIRMPGMNGLVVLSELRILSPGARVIVLTGESDPRHRAAATERGACAFFSKPFDDAALLAAVRSAVTSLA